MLVEATEIHGRFDYFKGEIDSIFGVINSGFGHNGYGGFGNDDFEFGSGYKKCMEH